MAMCLNLLRRLICGCQPEPTPPTPVYTFGGLQIAPGPLMYENGAYVIKDSWDYCSFNDNIYGQNEGSTYLNYYQCPTINGWRLFTNAEIHTILDGTSPGTSRPGATVNGVTGSKYSYIKLNYTTNSGLSQPFGLLLFPDNEIINGKSLNGINNTSVTEGFSETDINIYIEQGCAFLLGAGMYNSSEFFNVCNVWRQCTSTPYSSGLYGVNCGFSYGQYVFSYYSAKQSSEKSNNYNGHVRLVKPV